MITLLHALVFLPFAFSMDPSGEFIRNPSANLALAGLPGFFSSPARTAQPGFGFSYAQNLGVDMQVAGASGEMGFGLDSNVYRYRLAFMESYTELDSIYRQLYSEVDLSVTFSWIVLGAGYGASLEWIPREQEWFRHRYKVASSLVFKELSASLMVHGWLDDLSDFSYLVGAGWGCGLVARRRISVFVEYDGTSFDVGSAVRFRYCNVFSAYRFPGFGISVRVEFSLGRWSVDGLYDSAGSFWRWLGGGVSHYLHELTIF